MDNDGKHSSYQGIPPSSSHLYYHNSCCYSFCTTLLLLLHCHPVSSSILTERHRDAPMYVCTRIAGKFCSGRLPFWTSCFTWSTGWLISFACVDQGSTLLANHSVTQHHYMEGNNSINTYLVFGSCHCSREKLELQPVVAPFFFFCSCSLSHLYFSSYACMHPVFCFCFTLQPFQHRK